MGLFTAISIRFYLLLVIKNQKKLLARSECYIQHEALKARLLLTVGNVFSLSIVINMMRKLLKQTIPISSQIVRVSHF